MVVALFGLSLVMIVGGIASVVQGFPYVRLESGLAMVIGGATAFSSGVILLGLSAVVMRLKRLEGVLAESRAPQAMAYAPPDFGARPAAPAAVAGAAGLAGLTVAAPALVAERREPSLDAPAPEIDPSDRIAPASGADLEPTLPDLLLPETATPVEASEDAAGANDTTPEMQEKQAADASEPDLFVPPPVDAEDGKPDSALRASLDDPPAEDTETCDAPPDEDAKPEERQVVGTYASGGNTYVMFADGSIEADTPRGRFTFGSLEELKSFVEAGGEADARGAA